jgi:hypothetical protein
MSSEPFRVSASYAANWVGYPASAEPIRPSETLEDEGKVQNEPVVIPVVEDDHAVQVIVEEALRRRI